MVQTFKSRKDPLFIAIIVGVISLMMILTVSDIYLNGPTKESGIVFLIDLAISLLLIWIFFKTRYTLSTKELRYFCGPLKGVILIEDIKEIQKNTTKWIGYKPATARKGLVIRYNKYDEVYISPDDNDTFIKELLKLKANIKIT
ncbi:PH domain-containing protein [Pedobacter sp. SD-b]|uniref:PH domain-containing protein n=1 Tax=Pedobacter segetis TaxID=2793069 RepID=A0ABS1BH39_9SPHI|nr:PH domain-containing protein [Pedobacter segetis]MBK0382165.1 PH domain-containing protein [Pedobacter segetis]